MFKVFSLFNKDFLSLYTISCIANYFWNFSLLLNLCFNAWRSTTNSNQVIDCFRNRQITTIKDLRYCFIVFRFSNYGTLFKSGDLNNASYYHNLNLCIRHYNIWNERCSWIILMISYTIIFIIWYYIVFSCLHQWNVWVNVFKNELKFDAP